jgi:hypothetical protein
MRSLIASALMSIATQASSPEARRDCFTIVTEDQVPAQCCDTPTKDGRLVRVCVRPRTTWKYFPGAQCEQEDGSLKPCPAGK